MRNVESSQVRKMWTQILGWVEAGEQVEILKYRKVVARIVPVEKSEIASRVSTADEELQLSRLHGVTQKQREQRQRDEILRGVNRKPRSKT